MVKNYHSYLKPKLSLNLYVDFSYFEVLKLLEQLEIVFFIQKHKKVALLHNVSV